MAYSTMAFIETLQLRKRSMWRRDFIEPVSVPVPGSCRGRARDMPLGSTETGQERPKRFGEVVR
jgi:hypothetical protein